MKRKGIVMTVLAAMTLSLVVACGGRQPQTVVQVTPPPAEPQVIGTPPPPAPRQWVPGQWVQQGPELVWRPGHWQ